MRTIIARFEIEDNDIIEHQLFQTLDGIGCKDFKKLTNTDVLYEKDEYFRKLAKNVKEAKKAYNDYINKAIQKK